jgi:hypothetical protein
MIRTLCVAGLLCAVSAQARDYRIEHMEPPFWWSGMQHKTLQLMVHGKGIAELEPALAYPGVSIAAVTRVPNRNYLFIDLALAPDAAPGAIDLRFTAPGAARPALRYSYQLRARTPGSAQRKGFGPEDVILNLMPDRFANGDPANDSLPGMPDRLARDNGSGRHGGDLRGMTQHLDYLADMGYTQLWPTPLVENNMPAYSYHGYAATDLYKMDARYGSNDDYLNFTAQARSKGIGIIQDVVLNHIGSKHWWMQDMPMPDWISYNGKPVLTAHHRLATQDPYGSKEDIRNYTEGWFSPDMPDMNQANPFMANYLVQNSIWWIEYAGLSGLRVDTYGYSNIRFLTEWSRRVMQEYPNLNLVGEEWSSRVPVVARWQRGKQNFDGYVSHMPSMMDFPLNFMLRKALADTAGDYSLSDIYETLAQDSLYPDAGNLVLFEGNHDIARIFSVLHGDPGLFRIAMAYVLTAPRVPQLYYGSEVPPTCRACAAATWPSTPVRAGGHEMKLDSVSAIRDGSYNGGQAIPCDCFETGEKWHYVWTRDLSYAADLGLGMLDPQRVRNSLLFKLSGYRDGVTKAPQAAGSDDGLQIIQDTGSGGSWPVSTDRVTWAFGAEEVLKALPPAERAAFAVTALKALATPSRTTALPPST